MVGGLFLSVLKDRIRSSKSIGEKNLQKKPRTNINLPPVKKREGSL